MKKLSVILLTAAMAVGPTAAFAQANVNANTSATSGGDVGGNNAPAGGTRPQSNVGVGTSTSGTGTAAGANANIRSGGNANATPGETGAVGTANTPAANGAGRTGN